MDRHLFEEENMAQEASQLLPVPEAYGALMAQLKGQTVFGVEVDDSPMLRDLVRLAYELSQQDGNCSEVLYRLELLVLGNLAGTFTFNHIGLELGAEGFPNTLPHPDRERYVLCLRRSSDQPWLQYLAPGRYGEGDIRKLSTQLGARIGDCPIYALTLAILLVSCGLCARVILVGHPPHAWVAYQLNGMSDMLHCDLSVRSHGRLESDTPDYYVDGFESAPHKIPIWPLEECTL